MFATKTPQAATAKHSLKCAPSQHRRHGTKPVRAQQVAILLSFWSFRESGERFVAAGPVCFSSSRADLFPSSALAITYILPSHPPLINFTWI